MILTALALYFQFDRKFQTWILETFPQYGTGLTRFEDNQFIQTQLQNLKQPMTSDIMTNDPNSYPLAPELILGGQWFNSPPLTLKELKGKVVLVDFWTYTCINCIRTLPYLRMWHEKYAAQGLIIIGVHSPEFEFEKNPDNLKKAIQDYGLKYPIMQDNNFATWNAYQNHYWPAKYLVDKDGRIRYTHFGEGNYNQTEAMIQTLLKETGVKVTSNIKNPDYQIYSRTPELYLGLNRIEYLVSPEKIIPNQPQTFTLPHEIPLHHFALEGKWTITNERAIPSMGSKLILNFESKDIFLVVRPRNPKQEGKIDVLLDGDPLVSPDCELCNNPVDIVINEDRLYELYKLSNPDQHTLTLEFLDSNLELYAFTFG